MIYFIQIQHKIAVLPCVISLVLFKNISPSRDYYDNINVNHLVISSLFYSPFLLMNCSTFYFHALLGVTKVGPTKGQCYFMLNFWKTTTQKRRFYIFILLPIASLLIRQ
uniref:Uncharacterized protein n=1 Tax=Heterorhabditis bacteriophora TaxID=37862 RepID=A0A1I7WHQ6_HETBA